MKTRSHKSTTALAWDIPVRLLQTPIVLRQVLGVFLISFVFLSLLMSLMLGFSGDFAAVPKVLGILALVHLGLVGLGLLVMLFYFGNRLTMHFRLDSKGVHSAVVSRRARASANAATVVGLATGQFSVAGAGLLARTGAESWTPWGDVQRVKFDDAGCTIHLLDGWHTLAAIFCLPEQYAQVKAYVQAHTQRK